MAVDRTASRYEVRDIGARFNELVDWREDVRYVRSGELDEKRVRKCVAQAREFVDGIFFSLWADGRIEIADLK